MTTLTNTETPSFSIAVRAWNEEASIRTALESVFRQSLFQELARRGERCEVLCVANGCTDRTAGIAAAVFEEQQRQHPYARAFTARVAEIAQAGRNNTWNAFVHALSHPEAKLLYIMDSDLVFNRPDTLYNMYAALLRHPEAVIASDRQEKDLQYKSPQTWWDRLSLATSDMTRTIQGQMTGQLYCIRSAVARRLYLPRDLGAPDDGFIKAVVCTNFFQEPLEPGRIIQAENASHIYEAYRTVREILNNQKRQMIGQTIVHVLIEYVKQLPLPQRTNLAESLRQTETMDPDWLKHLIQAHVARLHFFWRLFPDALTFRFRRWWKLTGWKKVTHFPAALAGFGVTLVACARAYRHLKRGETHYWPKARRDTITQLGAQLPDPATGLTCAHS